MDKHFRKEGFEIIADGLPAETITSITIISGIENCNERARSDYKLLKDELANRGIPLSWRSIHDASFLSKWHDRWLIADNLTYNIPPILSILKGQRADMICTNSPPILGEFIECSEDISR